jgi:hypothetical protein
MFQSRERCRWKLLAPRHGFFGWDRVTLVNEIDSAARGLHADFDNLPAPA